MLQKIKLNCREATMMVVKRKDGVLSMMNKLLLTGHLLTCKPCRIFNDQNDLIDKCIKEMAHLDPDTKQDKPKVFFEQVKKGNV